MTLRITSIFLTVFILSCSYSDKDFYLSETERAFLDAFRVGDTLYYESSTKQVDKILVLRIDSNQKKESGYIMALPAYNDVFVSIKHLPLDTFQSISEDMTTKKIDTISEKIICISKHPQQRETVYSFQFKHFFSAIKNGLGQIHSDTVINGKNLTNYFIIKEDVHDKDTSYAKVEQLYWTQAEGLVAYKLTNGIYWTKKSSR